MTRLMYDSIDISQIPADAGAVAGYVNGRWPTFTKLARFKANRLSIAVSANADAACLDVERGDATPAQAPGWVHRQHERGEPRPVIYASRDAMGDVLRELAAGGIARGNVRLWSAHYGLGPHICGPVTCGAGFQADATQWTDKALGRNLDESLLADGFFPPAPAHHARKLPKPRAPKVHRKVAAATAGAAIGAAITAIVHAAGVRIDPELANAISAAAALIAGYLTPSKKAA